MPEAEGQKRLRWRFECFGSALIRRIGSRLFVFTGELKCDRVKPELNQGLAQMRPRKSIFLREKKQGYGFFVLAVSLLGFVSLALAQSDQMSKILKPEEKEWLKQHSQWRLGVDPAWPPIEMMSGDEGYVGLGADYINLVAKHLGVTTRVLPALSWSEVLDKARNREVDVLPAVAHTFERSEYLNFSEVYIEFPLVIITKIDKNMEKW
jgi:hypothetical protein